MTNTQLWLAILIPTFTVLIGIFRSDARLASIEGRLSGIEGDLRTFYRVLGERSAKLEHLEKR